MTKVADPRLSAEGEKNFLWAKAHMGALTSLAETYSRSKPVDGVRLGVCLHVTKGNIRAHRRPPAGWR